MKNPFARPGPLWTNDTPWWERAVGTLALVGIVLGVAFVAAGQITSPNERVLQVVAAGAIVFLAFRSKTISALAFAVLLLPFPKSTSYGNTNVAFVLLMFLVWIFRVSTRREPPPRRISLAVPLLGLTMAYCLSFYNVEPENLVKAWSLFLAYLTYVLVLFMVVNIVRTGEHVKTILGAQLISCAIVCVFAVYEQSNPGARIIPGWIEFGATKGIHDSVRVGSTFLDYELFGEYCALNLFIQLFLWTRATSQTRRWILTGIMLLTLFCLFSTVTRGAILSFVLGAVYMVWLNRRRLDFVKLVGVVTIGLIAVVGGDFVVSHFTSSDSVLERMFGTEFEDGLPDTRAGAWKQSVGNILDHPIIGHGPFFVGREGVEVIYWPHNVYLFYAHIVGIVGLLFYLWLLWELWKVSRPRAESLATGTDIEALTLVARVALFVFVIDQVKIDYLRNERYSFFVWFLFGLVYAIGRVARDEAEARARARSADPNAPALAPPAAHGSRRDPARPPRVAERPALPRVSAVPAIPPR